MELIITRGLPASGKSTWARGVVAKNDHFVRVNRDDIRASVHDGVWDFNREKVTEAVRDAMISAAFKMGKSAISDDTNLHPKVMKGLVKLGTKAGASVKFKDFTDVTLEECIRRNSLREGSANIPESAIRDMHSKRLNGKTLPTIEELLPEGYLTGPFSQRTDLPPCIIVDIDGTLATMGPRSPYDDANCEVDTPHEYVVDVVKSYISANPETKFIVMSGRDEGRSREATKRWLAKNRIYPDDLYMRPAGDVRSDNIIKRELYEHYVKDVNTVKFVVDDRDQVVDLWRRDMGFNCLQVNYGAF